MRESDVRVAVLPCCQVWFYTGRGGKSRACILGFRHIVGWLGFPGGRQVGWGGVGARRVRAFISVTPSWGGGGCVMHHGRGVGVKG